MLLAERTIVTLSHEQMSFVPWSRRFLCPSIEFFYAYQPYLIFLAVS